MKVTVTTLNDQLFTLDVGEEMELENFKALCEMESGIPAGQIVVMFEGKPLLDDKKDLKSYNIKENDVLLLQQMVLGQTSVKQPVGAPAAPSNLGFDFSTIQVPPMNSSQSTSNPLGNDPAHIYNTYLTNPEEVALLRANNPRLAEAFDQGLESFSKVLKEQVQARAVERQRQYRMLVADPFDEEAQKLIAEEIQRQQIDNNMEIAMEHHPESFGQVAMLYINCKVNGFPIKAFVDSGAQSTIMSKACAERCNIMRLVDRRWAGIAKGVGTQRIIGRIHLVQIQIEKDYLASSFTILENQPMDMLLGLDMLKRHQCNIDLKRNYLEIGTTGTKTPFLAESELPEFVKNQGISNAVDPSDEDAALAEAINRSVKETGNFSIFFLLQKMANKIVNVCYR